MKENSHEIKCNLTKFNASNNATHGNLFQARNQNKTSSIQLTIPYNGVGLPQCD